MAIAPSKDQSALEEFDANYEAFMRCGAQASLFADEAFLREMGIYEQVEGILEVFGWKRLLTISCETNVEDTCEFLASVEKRGKYMRYRHRGVYYRASKKHLKKAFKWTTSSRDETDQHTDNEAWEALTWSEKKFKAGRSLGSEIREPQFFYLQRLISNTVVARHNGAQRLGVLDMSIMKGLVFGAKVKFGLALVEHWTRIRPTGKVSAGGMITYYLRRIHRSDHVTGQTVLEPEFLTKAKMTRMRAIRVSKDGYTEWCYEGFAAAPMSEGIPVDEEDIAALDDVPAIEQADAQEDVQAEDSQEEQPAARRRRARAPVREQVPLRRSARVRNQARGSAQAQSSAQIEHPWMDPQAQRRWMFNVERVMEYAAPDFAIMNIEPPPEWMPGMPIPSGYKMRDEASYDGSHDDDMNDLEDEPKAESSGSPTF